MRIYEALDIVSNYKRTITEVPYSDAQAKAGYITLKCVDDDTKVALSMNGNYAVMDDYGNILEEHLKFDAWQDLEGKEFVRWSPVRVVKIDTVKMEGGKEAVKEALTMFENTIKDLEYEKEQENENAGKEDEKVYPYWLGNSRKISAYTKNGLEVRLFTPRTYKQMMESRRFFKKERLPIVPDFIEGQGFYIAFIADENKIKEMGRNLGAAMREDEADILSWCGIEADVEKVNFEKSVSL